MALRGWYCEVYTITAIAKIYDPYTDSIDRS